MTSELNFKRWFRSQFPGWSETNEPRRGSGLGMPDLQLLIRSELLPVELKVGFIKGDRLYVAKIRPAQIGWHLRFRQAGGTACIVVGVWDKERWLPLVPPWTEASLTGWRRGWALADCREWEHWVEDGQRLAS